MERDRHKQLVEHTKKINQQKKELELSKNMRKEVDINAGGYSRYRIKEGPNKGKVLEWPYYEVVEEYSVKILE